MTNQYEEPIFHSCLEIHGAGLRNKQEISEAANQACDEMFEECRDWLRDEIANSLRSKKRKRVCLRVSRTQL